MAWLVHIGGKFLMQDRLIEKIPELSDLIKKARPQFVSVKRARFSRLDRCLMPFLGRSQTNDLFPPSKREVTQLGFPIPKRSQE